MPSSQPLYRTLHPINIPNVRRCGRWEYIGKHRNRSSCLLSGGNYLFFFFSNLPSPARQPEMHPTVRERFSAIVSTKRKGHRRWLRPGLAILKVSLRLIRLFCCSLVPSNLVGHILLSSLRGTNNITCSPTHSISRYQSRIPKPHLSDSFPIYNTPIISFRYRWHMSHPIS